jgi:hypothetical protein
LSIIRRVFSELAAMGVLDADPSAGLRMGRPRQYEPRPITEEEL